MKWPEIRLGQLARVFRGASPRPKGDPRYFNGPIPWLKIGDVPPGSRYVEYTTEGVTEAGKQKSVYVPENTLLLSNSASVGRPVINRIPVCIHDGWLGISEIHSTLNQAYLYWYFVSQEKQFQLLAPSGTQKNLNTGILKSFLVPLPPPSEQQRIIEILDQGDFLRRMSIEADNKTTRILPSLFNKLFGNPTVNPKAWTTERLGDLFDVCGGGTPSKSIPEYWIGDIPWVSPKDMKCDVILDTQDHITLDAVSNSATRLIKKDSILIVYRSGILAHSFPVAIAGRDLTINQDLKALTTNGKVSNEYLYGLLCAAPNMGLACVKKGATVHNVDGERFLSLNIPIPPQSLQKSFSAHLKILLQHKAFRQSVGIRCERIFSILLRSAFTGELTAKWREAHMNMLLAEIEEQTRALTNYKLS